MGCDIHIALEKKVGLDRLGNKWVMVNRLEGQARCRNYPRFSALAGVRYGYGDKLPIGSAKGVPHDVSESAKLFIDEWGADGHSHSYMPVKDAASIFLETEYQASEFCKSYPCSCFFDVEEDEADDYRIVFFFDN